MGTILTQWSRSILQLAPSLMERLKERLFLTSPCLIQFTGWSCLAFSGQREHSLRISQGAPQASWNVIKSRAGGWLSDYIPSSLLGFTNLCQPKPATVKSDAKYKGQRYPQTMKIWDGIWRLFLWIGWKSRLHIKTISSVSDIENI